MTPRALRTLRLLGVTHVLRGTTGRAADPPYRPTTPYEPLSAPGLSEIYAGPDARVYRLDGALPRAWVVSAQQPVDSEEAALEAVTSPGFDPLRVRGDRATRARGGGGNGGRFDRGARGSCATSPSAWSCARGPSEPACWC